ncbi:MAG: thioredoxin-dependent thiol peroxidase [Variibacter sp.]|nr:thioredoxin-dependent thiol peroxidase [Variibacter sp.]
MPSRTFPGRAAAEGPAVYLNGCRTNETLAPAFAYKLSIDIGPLKETKGRRVSVELAAGDPAPAFTLPRDDGKTVSLDDFKGRKLVLYFYPKADTPGCTTESRAFSAAAEDFKQAGAAILGVSADPVKKQAAFKRKHALALPLGSDESHEMLLAYGTWVEKSMYGRKYMGIDRATFLIGPDGRIARIWRKVKVPGHVEDVLAAAKALKERR